jgi:hypothetical protein
MNLVFTLKKLHTESASLHALILPENISKKDLPKEIYHDNDDNDRHDGDDRYDNDRYDDDDRSCRHTVIRIYSNHQNNGTYL